jgi:hypothetical protein
VAGFALLVARFGLIEGVSTPASTNTWPSSMKLRVVFAVLPPRELVGSVVSLALDARLEGPGVAVVALEEVVRAEATH